MVESLSEKESTLHFLKPTGLDIHVHKCSIDDLQLAKLVSLFSLKTLKYFFESVRIMYSSKRYFAHELVNFNAKILS